MSTTLLIAIGVAAVVLLALVIWILSLRRVVPTNEVHIVRRGAKTETYGAPDLTEAEKKSGGKTSSDYNKGNSYYEFPVYIPGLGVSVKVLPLKIIAIEIKNYEAFDKDRVPFEVDIQSFFRISDYVVAASRIQDVTELSAQLRAIVEGAVRSILAKDYLNEIMGERSKYGQQFTEEVKDELKSWGVDAVKNIELMDVRDANNEKVISNIMAKKKSEIERESRITVAKNNQAAREQEIESERGIALKEQDKLKEVGLRKATVAKEVGIADEQSTQAVKEQARITKERDMEVRKVEAVRQAEIDREATIISAEATKRKTEIDAEAARRKAELDAEATLVKTTKEAEGNLVMATKTAEGIRLEGEAKATAEKQMQLASVEAQLTLAKEVGENQAYQTYLIQVRQIEAQEAVGKAQAENIGHADIKIIAGGGNVAAGVKNVGDAFSPAGGFNLAGAVEAFAGTETGQALLEKLGLTKK